MNPIDRSRAALALSLPLPLPLPLPLAVALLLAGCAGPAVVVRPGESIPLPDPSPTPWPSRPEAPASRPPGPAPAPPRAPVSPAPTPVPQVVAPPAATAPIAVRPAKAPVSAAEVRALALQLLPTRIGQRAGWADDLAVSFAALGIPAQPHKLCAIAAVIEQESGWQADPPVAGLSKIATRELDKKREAYGIPKAVFDLAMLKRSPDGRSYADRLARLRTERELSALFEDMIREIPFGVQLLGGQNPVRTGGSTQVSIAWAQALMAAQPYPWRPASSAREEVFKRRGGVYFGAAMLLDYPVSYDRMIYRFADFNAGRYASRNAAFQTTLARLTGLAVVPDGDLLRYRAGQPLPVATDPSQAWAALKALPALGLSARQLEADLRQEKAFAFESSATWRRVMALAAQRGLPTERARLPDIALKSPKITRPLTTAWFAERCETRYRACLARAEPPGGSAAESLRLNGADAP